MEGLILIGVGFAFFLIIKNVQRKISRIDAIGKSVNGVIFSHESTIDSVSNNAIFYPVVRFTTTSKEWITAKSQISVMPGIYKNGQTVQIIYDPEKPTSFYIKERYTQIVLRVAGAFSLCLICIGLYLLIFIEKPERFLQF